MQVSLIMDDDMGSNGHRGVFVPAFVVDDLKVLAPLGCGRGRPFVVLRMAAAPRRFVKGGE
jgi:hypothetical protein